MYPDPEPDFPLAGDVNDAGVPHFDESYDRAWSALERGFNQAAAERADHHKETTMSYRNVRISYTTPGITGRQTKRIEIPATARNLRCELEIAVEPAPPIDDFDVVRCVFPSDLTRREYCYRDGGVKPGEYAIVHSPRTGRPEIVRVTGYGRNDYTGPIFKVAAPVPAPSELRT